MNRGEKKILVLGTGNAQVDLILFCKEIGLEVHACSYKREGRGIVLADYFEVIDIKDIEAIEAYVQDKSIDIVYSIGSDVAMPAACALSEKLGLPHFVNSGVAITCNDKNALREKLMALPNFTVPYLKLSNAEDLSNWNNFPAIVKPSDSQGQRGVQKVNNQKEASQALTNALDHSPTNKAIIETFIEGPEVSVNLFMHEGEIIFSYLSERESFPDLPGGIIKAHHWPAQKTVDEKVVLDMCSKVAAEIGIANGPAYFQIKIDANGIPKVIEVTPRLDGCHMWRLIRETVGVDLLNIIVSQLLGAHLKSEEFTLSKSLPSKGHLRFFTAEPKSTFEEEQFQRSERSEYTECYYQNGEEIRTINGYREKTGYEILIEK